MAGDTLVIVTRRFVDYVLGLARNERLVKRIGKALRKSRSRHVATGRASRRFRAFRYRTARKVWVSFSCAYPYREEFAAIAEALRAKRARAPCA